MSLSCSSEVFKLILNSGIAMGLFAALNACGCADRLRAADERAGDSAPGPKMGLKTSLWYRLGGYTVRSPRGTW